MLCAFCTNKTAAFALAVVQETLEHLDSYQDGDYSGILLRLEYLNRIIINCGDLPDSIVAGIGSATRGAGGAVLPYITYTGMCRPKGS